MSFFPVEFFKNHCTFSFSNAKSFRRKKSGDHQFDFDARREGKKRAKEAVGE